MTPVGSGAPDARPPGRSHRHVLAIVLFVLGASLLLHLRFSWLGFNPTDEGFVLAYSRRLLEGQVPHRDFISIRPVGSALLHLPVVLLGGSHTFWLSRLVFWIELVTTSIAWTFVITALLGRRPSISTRLAWSLVAVMLSAHYFPAMAWHTVDGLFISAVGLLLCVQRSRRLERLGYLVLGAAPLFKQNYAVLVPAALILLGGHRQPACWLASVVPSLVYVVALLATGGLSDAITQMTSQTDVLGPGVRRYLWEYAAPWGALFGFLAIRELFRSRVGADEDHTPATPRPWLTPVVGVLSVYAILIAAASTLAEGRFLGAASFGLFGAAAGATLYLAMEPAERRGYVACGLLTLLTAWSCSISVGYNTPALATGPLALLLLSLVRRALPAGPAGLLARVPMVLDVVLIAVAAVSFHAARTTHVYQDRPAPLLTRAVGPLLRGGAGIFTNENTAAFLEDLGRAVARSSGTPYAIIPDLAAYWVTAPDVNPLPIDWAQSIELNDRALVDRVIDAIAQRRGALIVIVQKVDANVLASGFTPLPDSDHYAVVRHVRRTLVKIDETAFFELYR